MCVPLKLLSIVTSSPFYYPFFKSFFTVSGMILVLPFFRPSYEENDSQSDQLTLVDQLLLSERHLDVIDITNENNPVVILTENSAST